MSRPYRMTKKQIKDFDRIVAWLENQPFKENSRDKNPHVPVLDIRDVLNDFTPPAVTDLCQFFTPLEMGAKMVGMIPSISNDGSTRLLEPAAGIGHLIYYLRTFIPNRLQITAFEINKMCAEVGKKLYPEVDYRHADVFDHVDEIRGQYDYVLMNPPFNQPGGMYQAEQWIAGKAKRAEHIFLALAIYALKPGGQAFIIAPWNFSKGIPRSLRPWIDARIDGELSDYGELPGEFANTGTRVHGWELTRNDFDTIPFHPQGREAADLIDAAARAIEAFDEDELERAAAGQKSLWVTAPQEPDPSIVFQMTPEEYAAAAEAGPAPEEMSRFLEGIEASKGPSIKLPIIQDELSDHLKEPVETYVEAPAPPTTGELQLSLFDLISPVPLTPVFEGTMKVEQLAQEFGAELEFWLKPTPEFVRTVKKFGVINPIILTQPRDGDSIKYTMRDGKRRLLAAIMCGLPEINVRVFLEPEITGDAITLITNSQRSENPAAEYGAIYNLIERGREIGVSVSLSDIARVTGMKKQTIKKRMELGRLDPNLFEALADNRITRGVAEKAAKMTAAQQKELVSIMVANNGKLHKSALRQIQMAGTVDYVQQLPDDVFFTPGGPVSGPETAAPEDLGPQYKAALERLIDTLEGAGTLTPQFDQYYRDVIYPLVKGEPYPRR